MELAPFTGSYLVDPSARWRVLLDTGKRAHFAHDLGMWVLTDYADVKAALSDKRLSNALTLAPMYEMCPEALKIVMEIDAPPTTAAADAPTHTRTRRALRATFANTHERVREQYGPFVAARIAELLDPLTARRGETVDLVREFTAVLPLLVIVDILGLPEEDVPDIKRWSDGQIALIWGQPDQEQQVRLAQGLLDFWRYCQRLVARANKNDRWKSAARRDFVVDALAFRNGADEVLTLDEIASLAFNLLVAGHETTAGLLAHSVEQALTGLGRVDMMTEFPAAIDAHVEETLRFKPPIDGWLRVATEDYPVGDETIPAGARVLLLIGAAGRDGSKFMQPDQFTTSRVNGHDHLAFGHGPHFCIGAALARLEASSALHALLTEFPGLRLADGFTAQFKPNAAFRAHHNLLVTIPGAP